MHFRQESDVSEVSCRIFEELIQDLMTFFAHFGKKGRRKCTISSLVPASFTKRSTFLTFLAGMTKSSKTVKNVGFPAEYIEEQFCTFLSFLIISAEK